MTQAEDAANLAERLHRCEAELEAARAVEHETSTVNKALRAEVDHWVRAERWVSDELLSVVGLCGLS